MVSLTQFNHFSLQKKASWWKNIQLKYLLIRNNDTSGIMTRQCRKNALSNLALSQMRNLHAITCEGV